MFISAEGVEGCGKTTILKMIYEKLLKEGYKVLLAREPGGVKISEQIRNIILNKENTDLDNRSEALLFAASRRQLLVEKIYPALNNGYIVLCDRFVDSSLAYQGGGKGLGVENVLNINLFATNNTLPNLTLLFDIDPSLGLERIRENKNREVNRLDLERLDFYNKVRNTFLDLSKKYSNRYYVLDASKSIDEVFNEAYKKVIEVINGNN
ncbi:MAG: dTMP kinase [Firmicutes bacterium]|uniref:Thymidylate kinase n=1 Tax=Candidatus Onthovivens merdipullorum TaxID=2840889 RepID=A0A9D9DL26_9BACL|nr:dTMP kinase [Candidatus Onthovivens merdipullorum]